MRHFILTATIILGLIANQSYAQQTLKNKVAVYVTGDVDDGYKKVIGSKLVSGITQQPDYAAVERTADFLNELGKEQDYQMSGAVNNNQIVKLGQQFGVRYVLVADISEVLGPLFVAARLIDVQTGLIMAATETDKEVTNMAGLSDLAKETITNLFSGFQREAAEKELQKYDLKITGPYTSAQKLNSYYSDYPGKKHKVADASQIEEIIKLKKSLGEDIKAPIYYNFYQYNKRIINLSSLLEKDNAEDYSAFAISYSSLQEDLNTITNESEYWLIQRIANENIMPPQYRDITNPDGGYIYWIKDTSGE